MSAASARSRRRDGRTILIAGMGTSPAVLTETVQGGFGIILRKDES